MSVSRMKGPQRSSEKSPCMHLPTRSMHNTALSAQGLRQPSQSSPRFLKRLELSWSPHKRLRPTVPFDCREVRIIASAIPSRRHLERQTFRTEAHRLPSFRTFPLAPSRNFLNVMKNMETVQNDASDEINDLTKVFSFLRWLKKDEFRKNGHFWGQRPTGNHKKLIHRNYMILKY